MRAAMLLAFIITTLLSGCGHNKRHLFDNTPAKKYIGIQPLGVYDKQRIASIQTELSNFYKTPVIILPAVKIPKTFLNQQKGERYCADSILLMLKQFRNDSIVEVIGLLHKDIYTTKKDKQGNIEKPVAKYGMWGIAGLGYLPGDECVISDARLKTKDSALFKHRLKTVIIHEVGHNLGLPHCKVKRCIMSDTNEKIATIDNYRGDYCDACKKLLQSKF